MESALWCCCLEPQGERNRQGAERRHDPEAGQPDSVVQNLRGEQEERGEEAGSQGGQQRLSRAAQPVRRQPRQYGHRCHMLRSEGQTVQCLHRHQQRHRDVQRHGRPAQNAGRRCQGAGSPTPSQATSRGPSKRKTTTSAVTDRDQSRPILPGPIPGACQPSTAKPA